MRASWWRPPTTFSHLSLLVEVGWFWVSPTKLSFVCPEGPEQFYSPLQYSKVPTHPGLRQVFSEAAPPIAFTMTCICFQPSGIVVPFRKVWERDVSGSGPQGPLMVRGAAQHLNGLILHDISDSVAKVCAIAWQI